MHTTGFQIRNGNFFRKIKEIKGYAEAYDSTPHKESRRLTPRLRKKAISGWKRASLPLNMQGAPAIPYLIGSQSPERAHFFQGRIVQGLKELAAGHIQPG
jgi:hypothetical protein